MSYSEDQDNNQSNMTADQEGPSIHGSLLYISLVFKFTLTLIITIMASLVCVTIKKTKRLHQPHNIFVFNVMIADIILALWNLIPAVIMFITFVAGKDNTINCKLLTITYHPVIVYHTTFVKMAIDKVIAIGYPFKYKNIMTCRVATTMVCISWLLAVAMCIHILFTTTNGQEVPEYGVCLITGIKFLGGLNICHSHLH